MVLFVLTRYTFRLIDRFLASQYTLGQYISWRHAPKAQVKIYRLGMSYIICECHLIPSCDSSSPAIGLTIGLHVCV